MPIPTHCPLCKAESAFQSVITRHVFGDTGGQHAFFHCDQCDVNYLFPRLTKEQEKQFYVEEFSNFMASRAGATAGWNEGEKHIFANETTRLRRMRYIEPELGRENSILEIGCSSGFMLYPLIKNGFSCIGIEPSGVFKETLKAHNLEFYDELDELIKKRPSVKFDYIFHFFVLEHIDEPISFLEKQLSLLNPGGKIIFEIPNVEDPLYSIYDIPEFERFYWSIAHPWYFSKRSLVHLLKQLKSAEFNIKLDQRYDLSNHITWARDGKPGGMKKYSEKLGQEIEDSYREQLIKMEKCDTLIGIIKAPE